MPTTSLNLFNRLKSDASLLRAYTKGDASAFEGLYGRYKDSLFNSLYHQLGNMHSAEEVAQEVWMAVINKAESFDDKKAEALEDKATSRSVKSSSFRSWLFSIAHRRCADYWRKQYRKNDVELSEDTGQARSESNPDLNEAEETQPEYQQFIYELRQQLLNLPEEQRQSFILREEGFSYLEIADITEVGVETVKSRLRYAKKTLQECLGGEYD